MLKSSYQKVLLIILLFLVGCTQYNYSGWVDDGTSVLTISQNTNITGEATIGGVANDGNGEILCIKPDKTIGTCSISIIGVTCSCV